MKSPLQLIKAMESASSGKSEEVAQIEKINREKAKKLGLDVEVTEASKSIPGSVKVVASSSATASEADDDTATASDSSSDNAPEAVEQAQESVSAAQVLELANALKAEMENQKEAHKAELERINAEREAEVARVKAEAEATRKELEEKTTLANVMTDLNKLLGKTGGAEEKKPLVVEGSGSAELRTYERLIESAPKTIVTSSRVGRILQRDTRQADAYFRKNKESIRGGIEAVMKEAGFLNGGITNITTESLTIAQIPSVSFEYLSSMIRTNRYHDLVWHQFANLYSVPGVSPRMVASIPRYPYNARPASYLDRILTPGTALSNNVRNTTEQLKNAVVQECGLGKDDDNAPLGVSEFVEAMSLVDLEGIVERNLGIDYQSWKDTWIYTTYFAANTILYNNGNTVTSTAGDIATGDDGTMTRDFLIRLYAWMRTRKIPTYQDGCYALVTHPVAAAQLLSQLKDNERYFGQDMAASVASMLSRSTQNEGLGGELSGFLGKIDNFWIFTTNAHSVALEAGDPGAANVAFDATVGTQPTLSSIAFGRDAVAWGTSLPMQLREESATSFNRMLRLIWISHEFCTDLDVNEISNTAGRLDSERRVVQIRTLNEPV